MALGNVSFRPIADICCLVHDWHTTPLAAVRFDTWFRDNFRRIWLYRPRPLADEVSALSSKASTPVRIVLGLWIVAGAVYFLVSPKLDVVPFEVALAIVMPLLMSVAALGIFNLYRVIFWVAEFLRGK